MPKPLSNRRRKEIGKLSRKKYRRQMQQMIVEGVRSVASAAAAGAPLVDIVVTEERANDERVQALLAEVGDVPVYLASDGDMQHLSDVETPQGVLAVVRTELVAVEAFRDRRTVLALDGLQDPGNVGTMLRTAAWFGAEAVVAGAGTAGFFNPKVVRSSMGGLWDVELAQTQDLPALLSDLTEHGFHVYGADMEGTTVRQWEADQPSVLVLGSEAHGLSDAVRERLDERLVIRGSTRRRGAESLNVAVAAGIMMHQWLG